MLLYNHLRRAAADGNALILRNYIFSAIALAGSRAGGSMVNPQVANIFKRIPEAWNSLENAKRFAKSGGRKIWESGVYHVRINHTAMSYGGHGLLRRRCIEGGSARHYALEIARAVNNSHKKGRARRGT